MRRSLLAAITVLLVSLAGVGCNTVPKTDAERSTLQSSADTTLAEFKEADSSLDGVLSESKGYAVFPSIGKGGFIVGGAYGRGTVYEDARMIGYADMTQGAIGALIGGQTFSELIVFKSPEALAKFKTGDFTFGATANAVALDKGAAAATDFKDGVAIFTKPQKGLMAEASVGGQKFKYVPADEVGAEEVAAASSK